LPLVVPFLYTMQQTAQLTNRRKLFRHPAWALVAAFGTYFCMYGFRKPYTAATYSNVFFFGIEYKFLLIIAQTAGYVLAKWMGIKIVAEIQSTQRIKMLAALLFSAEGMLLLFAYVPRPWNIACLLLNGIFLGIIFGLVLGFLEGKKHTEILIAGLCASFIVSDGVAKSAGSWLLNKGVTENWMPFFAGVIFMLPAIVFISMLACVPPPSAKDIVARTARNPMTAQDRRHFFMKYAPGLGGIIVVYLLVTLLRSIRADFAPELWEDLGYAQTPGIFTQSELLVSLGVVVVTSLAIFISNHYTAFRFSLYTCFAGFILVLLAVFGLQAGLDKFLFMVLMGLGVYLPYVAVHSIVFERLIAMTRARANIGFLMYLADSVGYTGYIILMLLRYLTPPGLSILSLFLKAAVIFGMAGVLLVLYCNWYFKTIVKNNEQPISRLSTGQSSHF
jgi:Family of unknown function (DUF5690)